MFAPRCDPDMYLHLKLLNTCMVHEELPRICMMRYTMLKGQKMESLQARHAEPNKYYAELALQQHITTKQVSI